MVIKYHTSSCTAQLFDSGFSRVCIAYTHERQDKTGEILQEKGGRYGCQTMIITSQTRMYVTQSVKRFSSSQQLVYSMGGLDFWPR